MSARAHPHELPQVAVDQLRRDRIRIGLQSYGVVRGALVAQVACTYATAHFVWGMWARCNLTKVAMCCWMRSRG